MANPVSTETALHYPWGQGCEGWHLVQTPALSILEERMPPDASERRHLHQHARQFFYVLAGELTLEVEGTRYTLGERQGLEVAPGTAHQAFNFSAHDTRFLVTSQPPSHGDRYDA